MIAEIDEFLVYDEMLWVTGQTILYCAGTIDVDAFTPLDLQLWAASQSQPSGPTSFKFLITSHFIFDYHSHFMSASHVFIYWRYFTTVVSFT